MTRLIFGMVLGGLLVYGAMNYHVVRGREGVFLVPKLQSDLSAIYTDVRDFTLQDWRGNPTLAAAIMQSNRTQLFQDATHGGFVETVDHTVERLFRPSPVR